MMNTFDNKVQVLKFKVLSEVARLAFSNTLLENITEIPKTISPGKIPTMRCCVYKERAILAERVRLAIGGNRYNKKVIQVIDIACDDCPRGGYEVTSVCRGCLAHRCAEICPVGAITFGNDQKAYIDKTKCIECGKCASTCPYSAIMNYKRPCESSCKVQAITMGENKEARIDYDKCIACGACVSQCPFGAITDRSYILDVIDLIKSSEEGRRYRVYAMVAPAIAAQLSTVTVGQVLEAIRLLGFTDIREVAEGADLVACEEAEELARRGFLTSSCCPAFVSYIEKFFPALAEHVSPTLSPMGMLAKRIKEADPTAKTVFIGPCTAKKTEFQRKEYAGLVDSVITFTELQALIAGKDIDVGTLPEYRLEDASAFGRRLARTGGLSEAICEAIRESSADFRPDPIVCSGIEECKPALMRAAKGVLSANFIEGMACRGGCINGAGSLSHSERNLKRTEDYAKAAVKKSLTGQKNSEEEP